MGQQAQGRSYVGRHRRAETSSHRTGKVVVAGVGLSALVLPLATGSADAASYAKGATARASIGSSGQQVGGIGSTLTAVTDHQISASGRYVSFVSQSRNLVSRDTNGTDPDVFVRDRVLNKTYLVSLDTAGKQTPPFSGDREDYSAGNPVLAGNAPVVAYVFRAQQSHSYDRPFLRNVQTGVTVELPHLDNFTDLLDISSNGRYVLMKTTAEEFPGSQLWVYDAVTRKATRAALIEFSPSFGSGSISDDGRYIAYDVTDGTTGQNQVFRIDRTRPTAVPVLVSVGVGGRAANAVSSGPSVSANGRYVAFQSGASNLVAGDTNRALDVFVRDLVTGTTKRASVGAGGRQANGASWPESISADGREVAFTSAATNLVTGDTNKHTDVFVRQLDTGVTTRVSVSTSGRQLDSGASQPVLSADGNHILFLTAAAIVPGDSNGLPDSYVRDVLPPR